MIRDEAEARAWLGGPFGATRETITALERLVAALREENRVQNLVSAASLGEVWVRHIADSAQLLLHVSHETTAPWLDLGTGAGFPGLVIAILRPDLPLIMVESRKRRVEWLKRARAAFAPRATVIGEPLERIDRVAAGVISARAFAPLDRLLLLSSRFSTDETLWLLPKGRNGANELREMGRNTQRMFHVKPSLTDADSVVLVGRGIPS
ncbi:MAG TPA: RsmG family class I SAM-dependent methyltransferase [Novosphingobium sp.]|nr:RsmG family class I SAM-dependent methyltransferase [Novosphingobium sp.]